MVNKKILLILIISISFMSYGKSIDHEQLQNRNGVYYEINEEISYTGTAFIHYENGQLKYKQNYKYGKPNGESIAYYENGKIQFKENYRNGKLNGKSIVYYKNGEIKEKNFFRNGKLIY